MSNDPLEPARYIGRRTRAWRHERNWTGQEAAGRLGKRLGRPVDWPELRALEEGAVLPDMATARCLTAMYGRELAQLILPWASSTPSTHFRQAPWPPRNPSSDDLKAVRRLLQQQGHDPSLAERFFELGASAGGARRWLLKFNPTAAFEWLAVRFGQSEAEKWSSAGCSVEQALQLKEIGLRPGDVMPSSHCYLAERGVANEVVLLWRHLEVEEQTATAWLDAGWDLLCALPWVLAGADSAAAKDWFAEGFDALSARALWSEMQANEAGRWRRAGVDASAWRSWRDYEFDPDEAALWSLAGLDTQSATEWRGAGFGSVDAAAFVAAKVPPGSAREWRDAGMRAENVRAWIKAGLDVDTVSRWREVTVDPMEVVAFERANLTPRTVKEWHAAGAAGGDIDSWRAGGFSPSDAARWAGTTPARALRLTRRGTSADTELARRAAGKRRLDEARSALAGTPRPAAVHTDSPPSTRSPCLDSGNLVPVCPACGRPISENGRCDCS